MFGKNKKTWICEDCKKELVGFLSKTKHNGKVYCSDCYNKRHDEEEAAIPPIQPPTKFKTVRVDTYTKNEIVFWLSEGPVRFHIFFYMDYYRDFVVEMTFLGLDRFSGKPAIVSWKDDTDLPIRGKVEFLSQEQFKSLLSHYPREVGRLFEGLTPENWREYQNITKPLDMSDICILLFHENADSVEIVIHSSTRGTTTLEHIETSKEKFEKWRDKKSPLNMIKYYSQLREDKTKHIAFLPGFDKDNFWKNTNTRINENIADCNCVIMMNKSKFVCTNKLPEEDVNYILDKAKNKHLKLYFKDKK